MQKWNRIPKNLERFSLLFLPSSSPLRTPRSMSSALCVFKRNALFYLVAVLIALALKLHYSQALPGDLQWILRPTSGLVSILSGERFTFEAGTGYICDAGRIIIAPACAGVNFMLMAFGMATFAGLHHMRGHRHRFAWVLGSLAASYGLTIVINTLRILVSIYTFHAVIFERGPAWERVHRLEGIVIYFFFQYLFYSMIRKVIERYTSRKPARISQWASALSNRRPPFQKIALTGLIPCAWYLAVTLAVPFLNGAPEKTGGRFYDHAAMVVSLCLMTWICIAVAKICGQGVRLLITGGDRRYEAQNSDR